MDAYVKTFLHQEPVELEGEFTRGHFKRGVEWRVYRESSGTHEKEDHHDKSCDNDVQVSDDIADTDLYIL